MWDLSQIVSQSHLSCRMCVGEIDRASSSSIFCLQDYCLLACGGADLHDHCSIPPEHSQYRLCTRQPIAAPCPEAALPTTMTIVPSSTGYRSGHPHARGRLVAGLRNSA